MKLKKTIYELFFQFLLKNFMLILLVLILPQIILIINGTLFKSQNCFGTTKIIISKAVTNKAIIDEIFTSKLDLSHISGVKVINRDIRIFGKSDEDCIQKYELIEKETSKLNRQIEEFWVVELTDTEKARFGGPILFNSIGGVKIEFAHLSDLDLDIIRQKNETLKKIYFLLSSLFVVILIFIFSNFKKAKFRL